MLPTGVSSSVTDLSALQREPFANSTYLDKASLMMSLVGDTGVWWCDRIGAVGIGSGG